MLIRSEAMGRCAKNDNLKGETFYNRANWPVFAKGPLYKLQLRHASLRCHDKHYLKCTNRHVARMPSSAPSFR
jgi:hypothetical protein